MLSFAVVLTLQARDTADGVFDSRVRTVQVSSGGSTLAPPVALVGEQGGLTVSFDMMSDDRDYMRFRVVRCDADWSPSTVADAVWLDGFNESAIPDGEFSRATSTHYVHYTFDFPNADINPSLSGNYLIEVFSDDDPDKVLFSRRVMLSDATAPVSATVTSRTDIDYNASHQQLEIEVDTEHADVANPYNDLTVKIMQNGRPDSEATVVHPLMVNARKAVYAHNDALIFPAGNNYRRMETVNTNYLTMGVDEIAYAHPYYHFRLATDRPRAASAFETDLNLGGRYVVREYNSSESDLEADYGVVHFSLDTAPGLEVYLDGDMTSRRIDADSRMAYNEATGLYEKILLLKQGAYSYQYLAVDPRTGRLATGPIEGDFWQTPNEYIIKVYTRRPGEQTDRLIGVSTINLQ